MLKCLSLYTYPRLLPVVHCGERLCGFALGALVGAQCARPGGAPLLEFTMNTAAGVCVLPPGAAV